MRSPGMVPKTYFYASYGLNMGTGGSLSWNERGDIPGRCRIREIRATSKTEMFFCMNSNDTITAK